MANKRKIVGLNDENRIFVRVNGKLRSKRFKDDATPAEIQQWRDDQLKSGKDATPVTATADGEETFVAGVGRYKVLAAMMATLDQYLAMLGLWLDALGRERAWTSITSDEITAVLDRWLKTLAPSTVYHRRSALMAFFKKLNEQDPKYVNPVLKTQAPASWEPKDQSLDFELVHQVVDHMRAERYIAKGIRKPSLARIRAEVVAATGIPPGELLKLTKRSLRDLATNVVHLPGREKGQGTKARTAQLMPAGVDALRAFVAADAWGNPYWTTKQRNYQVSCMSKSFKRAARAVLAPTRATGGSDTTFHLYSLRHCVGAEVRRVADRDTVGRVLGHAKDSRCTDQYTLGAHAEVDRKALAEVAKARAAAVKKAAREVSRKSRATAKPAQKLPAEVTMRRKSRVSNKMRKVS